MKEKHSNFFALVTTGKILFPFIYFIFLGFNVLTAEIKGDWPPFRTYNGGAYPFESVTSQSFTIESPVTIVGANAELRNVAPKFIKSPTKGIMEYRNLGTSSHRFEFTPYPYAAGTDEVVWTGTTRTNGVDQDHNFTFTFDITDTYQSPIIVYKEGQEVEFLSTGANLDYIEESTAVATFELVDPDPTIGSPTIDEPSFTLLTTGEGVNFALNKISEQLVETSPEYNGRVYTYLLSYRGQPPNFESLGEVVYPLNFTVNDSKPNQTDNYSFNFTLKNKYEPPKALNVQTIGGTSNKAVRTSANSAGIQKFTCTLPEGKQDLSFSFLVDVESVLDGTDFKQGTYKLGYSLTFPTLDTLSLNPQDKLEEPDFEKVTFYKTRKYDESTDLPSPIAYVSERGKELDTAWTNGDRGQVAIELPESDYFTFESKPLLLNIHATANAGEEVQNLIELKINIQNDYEDAIEVVNEPSPNVDGDRVITFYENNSNPVWDFNVSDPDTLPVDQLVQIIQGQDVVKYSRIDSNTSDQPGAELYYVLSGPDREKFQIVYDDFESLVLYFKNPPDFEKPTSTNQSDLAEANRYEIDLTFHDSRNDVDPSVDDPTDELAIPLIIEVLNANDVPQRLDPNAESNYTITTKEDIAWDYDDKLIYRQDYDLKISDNDQGEDAKVYWRQVSASEDPKGKVVLLPDGNENNASFRTDNAPRVFRYEPYSEEYGEDNFTIEFSNFSDFRDSDESRQILFYVNIQNTSDKPKLGFKELGDEPFFFTDFLSGEDANLARSYLEDGQTIFRDLNFSENTYPRMRLPFSDGTDEQNITSIRASGPDVKKFSVSTQAYKDPTYDDGFTWWVDVNLSDQFLADYEGDNNYSLSLAVTDSGGDIENFFFYFNVINEDEPPLVRPHQSSPYYVLEEQVSVMDGLKATDPENKFDRFFWELEDPKGYFRLVDANNSEEYGQQITASEVNLEFEKVPSFEDPNEKELNVTISVSHPSQSGPPVFFDYDYQFILIDAPDPPRIKEGYAGKFIPQDPDNFPDVYHFNQKLEIVEVVDESSGPYTTSGIEDNGSFDLSNYFNLKDEDNQTISFSKILPKGYPKPSFQSYMTVSRQGQLSFTTKPDYEDGIPNSGEFMVRLTDGQFTIWAVLQIEVLDNNDPPQPIAAKIQNPELPVAVTFPVTVTEDLRKPLFLSDYIEDEDAGEDYRELFYTPGEVFYFNTDRVAEGGIFLIGEDLEGYPETINFTPPPNEIGMFSAQLFFTDGDNNSTIDFIFEVEEVVEPPVVSINNEWFVDFDVNKSAPVLDRGVWSFQLIEGERGVVQLLADDINDSYPVAFEWTLDSKPATYFRIVEDPDNSRLATVEWNPNHSDLKPFGGLPDWETLGGRDDGVARTNPTFEITVRTYEVGRPELAPESDYRGSIKLLITLVKVANKRPYFESTANYIRSLREESEVFVMPFTAYDPDDVSPIIYDLVEQFDFVLFDRQLASQGFLSFVNVPDFEIPKDVGLDNNYKVLVRATEDDDTGLYAEQLIEVQIINEVEVPSFVEAFDPVFTDANFSIVEQQEKQFPISGATEDENKNLLIRISGDGPDDRLFTFDSTSNLLSFVYPPDYENPEDVGRDNLYEVLMQVNPFDLDKNQSISPTYREIFKIRVEDDEFPFYIPDPPGLVLTELELYENDSFVVDLDVVDEESPEVFLDLLFASDTGAGFLANTKSGSSVSQIFNASQVQAVSLPLEWTGSAVLAGDLRNSGMNDVILLTSRSIRYYENDGAGNFLERTSETAVNRDLKGIPTHGVIEDIDFDGDQDLLVSYYNLSEERAGILIFRNDPSSGTPLTQMAEEIDFSDITVSGETFSGIEGRVFGFTLSDLDNDFDFDLAVPFFDGNQVVWFENNGTGTFANEGHSLAKINQPRVLQSFDLNDSRNLSNPFLTPDLIIGSDSGVHLAKNSGLGEFVITQIASHTERIKDVLVVDLDANRKPDVVFGTESALFFALGGQGGDAGTFGQASVLSAAGLGGQIEPASIHVYYTKQNPQDPILLVGDAANPNIHFLRGRLDYTLTPHLTFESVDSMRVSPDDGAGIYSIQTADLDSKVDFVEFSFYRPDDDPASEHTNYFDPVRFQAGGKLFFSNPPDYENPLDFEKRNEYEIVVQARKKPKGSDVQTQNDQRKIKVRILDVNEPPSIKPLPGTDGAGIYQHPENFLAVGTINASNPESLSSIEQPTLFSLAGGADLNDFEINATSGELSFKFRPDHENHTDRNKDGIYEVVVRAQEVSDDNFTDEKLFHIEVVDGSELPVLSLNLNPAFSMDEDTFKTFYLEDFGATDPNNPGGRITSFSIESPPRFGEALFYRDGNSSPLTEVNLPDLGLDESSIPSFELRYIPDANYSGLDELIVQAYNNAGLPADLLMEATVRPLPDLPASLIPHQISIPENTRTVIKLKGVDSDPGENAQLRWELADPLDRTFKIQDKVLSFYNLTDHETQNQYTVPLVLLAGGDRVEHNLTILIENLPDTPPRSAVIEQSNTVYAGENNSTLVDLSIFDPDGSTDLTFFLSGGVDVDLFGLSPEGLLFSVDPNGFDYEDPIDANQDNRYELSLFVGDPDLNQTYNFALEIKDRDEYPPVITSGLGNAEYSLSVLENTTFVYQATATDVVENVDGGGIFFRVSEDFEGPYFKIDSSGKLEFKTAPDYDNPPFPPGSNPYEVVVIVSDGTHEVSQKLFVQVENSNDLPVLRTSQYSLVEDGELIQQLDYFDEDGHTVTFSVSSMPKFGALTLQGSSFTYVPVPDFAGQDQFGLLVKDPYASNPFTIALNVSPQNDPPVAVEDLFYYYKPGLTQPVSVELNVLHNDLTGPDPVSEKASYYLTKASDPSGGIVRSSTIPGFMVYTPKFDQLGPDTFSYNLNDNGLSDTATAKVWVATSPSQPAWTYLQFFGSYFRDPSQPQNKWVYHTQMGWVYLDKASEILGATWMWRDYLGWFWTGETYFGWLFHDAYQKWLHWEGGVNEASSWRLRDEEGKIYNQKHFEMVIIREEVKKILPGISDLSSYIEFHPESSSLPNEFFTRSQKLVILRELTLYNNSDTLNKILDFEFQY